MSSEVRCWYLNQKGKATGPFAFSDLKSMAAQGTLKGHDLVFREGSAEWKRAYDWPELVSECFSDENRSSLSRLIKLPEEERAVDDQWVLLVREDGEKEVRFRQKGPFQADEIKRMLLEDKIKPSDHIWKKGAARWVPLYDVPEFRIHNLKMTKAAEASLGQVESMPDMAQTPDPFAAMMPATPVDVPSEKIELEEIEEPAVEIVAKPEPVVVKPAVPVATPAAVTTPVKSKENISTSVKPQIPGSVDNIKGEKPAPVSAAPTPEPAKSTDPKDAESNRQAVREWAMSLVKEAQKTDPDIHVPKAQVFSPEVTKTDHEIHITPSKSASTVVPTFAVKDAGAIAQSLDDLDGEESSSAPIEMKPEISADEPDAFVIGDEPEDDFVSQPLQASIDAKAKLDEEAVAAAEARAAKEAAAEALALKVAAEKAEAQKIAEEYEAKAKANAEAKLAAEAADAKLVLEAAAKLKAEKEAAVVAEQMAAKAAAEVAAREATALAAKAEADALKAKTDAAEALAAKVAAERAEEKKVAEEFAAAAAEAQAARAANASKVESSPMPLLMPVSEFKTSSSAPKPMPARPPSEEPMDFSDEVTPIPNLTGVESGKMPIFATGEVVPDDGSAEEIINPARLSENYSFEAKAEVAPTEQPGQSAKATKSEVPVAPKAPDAKAGIPKAATPDVKKAPEKAAVKPAIPAVKKSFFGKTPKTIPEPVVAEVTPAAAPVAPKKAPAPAPMASAAANKAASPPRKEMPASEYSYDFDPPKTLFSKMAPVFMVMLLGIFGAGIWATMNTDKSVFQSGSSSSMAAPSGLLPQPHLQEATQEVVEVPQPQPVQKLKPAPTPAQQVQQPVPQPAPQVAAQLPPAPVVEDDGPEVITVDAPVPEPVAVKPVPAPVAEKPGANPAADFDGKNPLVRINAAATSLEILGPFRKGELLRIRIEGRAGQILDLPALVQKYEVRAMQDNYYRVSMKDARIPKGEYLVGVQFGLNRFSRGVSYGKDSNFREALQNHRKAISFDQQQERKRLIQAAKEFGTLLTKAETQAKDAGAIKGLQKELEKKTPRELRLVRTNRYELIFFDYWEKLAAQWERVQLTMKDNPGRNPASATEFTRAKKMATSLESEMRSTSIWN